jgi:CvfB-like winged helix domain
MAPSPSIQESYFSSSRKWNPSVPSSNRNQRTSGATLLSSKSAGEERYDRDSQIRKTPKPASSVSSSNLDFSPGTEITVEVVSFGPMGASVSVIAVGHNIPDEQLPPEDEPPLAKGLILQKEIHLFRQARDNVDVCRGEILNAYVERIRDAPEPSSASTVAVTAAAALPKLDICLRAFGAVAKATEASVLILAKLNELPAGSTLPIGDKSPHEEISRYFPGVTKTAFKRAVGNLFDQKKVWPSPYAIRLYTDADESAQKRKR